MRATPDEQIVAPAPRPCSSCPYRLDVPARVWADDEYAKLPLYDRPTALQPPAVFQCHQGVESGRTRVCAGWAATHADPAPGHELLSLRVAPLFGVMTVEDRDATWGYSTDVRCFTSGAAAADWGTHGPDTDDTTAVQHKVIRRRPDAARNLLARQQTDRGRQG